MKPPIITVFGSSQPPPLSPAYQTAYALGRAIAEAGWVLCNGGYRGTMEASAKGAVDVGGHTIGVTCNVLGWRGGPNAYIRQEVPTFDLLARLNTLVRLGNAYVVLPGGTGTLVELALVWELFNKNLLRRTAPIVLLGDHWTPVSALIRRETPDALEPHVAANVSEVVDIVREAWERGRNPDEPADESPSG
jgi:uncharacterized protein (TIGR00730 family)